MIDIQILNKLNAPTKTERLANLKEVLKTTVFPPMVPQYINNHNRFQLLYIKDFHVRFNVFYIIKAMSIRELTWQIKQVVSEAQNFTSILPSLRIFSLKTYEIPDL